MADMLHHERLYRGGEAVQQLRDVAVTVCGAGAIGSNLVENLARQGFAQLKVIDNDRVEQHNVGTQVFGEGDVGATKVDVLRNRLFRAVGVEVEAEHRTLDDRNANKLLKGADIVVDAFDNTKARAAVQSACRASATACLHVGLSADYAEVIWDANYRVPTDAGQDVCDYPLARNLVLLAVAVATETLIAHVIYGVQTDRCITLADFSISELEPRANTATS